MRQLYFVISLFSILNLYSQNGLGIYDFTAIPQTGLENPAYYTGNDKHFSLPLMGKNQIFVGSTNVSYEDLFGNELMDIEDAIKTTAYNLSTKDLFLIQQKSDLIYAGFKTQKYHITFGIYTTSHLFSNFPKSLSELYYEGNTIAGKEYTIEGFNLQSNAVSVYHVGFQKNVDNHTSIGWRYKLYNEAFDIRSKGNRGKITVIDNANSTYKYSLTDVETLMHTSGIVLENGVDVNRSYMLRKLLFSGNKGLGMDIGMTKQYGKNWYFSTSLLDLGFIYHQKDVRNYKAQDNFETTDLNLIFNTSSPDQYWENMEYVLQKGEDYQKTDNPYFTLRPITWNVMLKYKMNQKRMADCNYFTSNRFEPDFKTALGGFAKVYIYNGVVFPSVSAFYERNFSHAIQLRADYTVNRFTYTQIGLTSSINLSKLNLYFSVDNLLGIANWKNEQSASVQFGLNAIF